MFCNNCQVILAREYLKEVNISSDQVKYLVEEARRGGVQVRLNLKSNSQSNNLMMPDQILG
jgi:RNase P subunit RPR2